MRKNIILVFLFLGICVFLSNCTRVNVRYDGVYYSEKSGYTSYIRFYNDGTVMTISSSDTITVIKDVLTKEQNIDYAISKGEFKITRDRILFSTESKNGTIDYDGQVFKNRLLLNVHSNINGNESYNIQYLFSPEFKMQVQRRPDKVF